MNSARTGQPTNGVTSPANAVPDDRVIHLPEVSLQSRYGPIGMVFKRLTARCIRFAMIHQASVNRFIADLVSRLSDRLESVERAVDRTGHDLRALELERTRLSLLAERIEFHAKLLVERNDRPNVRSQSDQLAPILGLLARITILEERFLGLRTSGGTVPEGEALDDKLAKVDERAAILERATSSITKLVSRLDFDQALAADRISIVERTIASTQAQLCEQITYCESTQQQLEGQDTFASALKRTDALASTLETLVHRLALSPYTCRDSYDVALGPIVPKASFDYVGFENVFRGPESLIKERQCIYVPFFESYSRVLDVGCGRGEFVELLSLTTVDVIGIDLNDAMVRHCRDKGIRNVIHGDVLEYLHEQGPESFGGIFSAQVIEHFSFETLYDFLKLARVALRPGGTLIAETVNPLSIEGWKTFFNDPTHVKPLFPEVMRFMCRSAGFRNARIFYPNGNGFDESDPSRQGEYAVVATR